MSRTGEDAPRWLDRHSCDRPGRQPVRWRLRLGAGGAAAPPGPTPEPAVGLPLADLAANWPSELRLAVDPGSENGLSVPPQAVQALAAYAQGPGGA